MKKLLAVVVLGSAVACGGSPVRTFSAPAPEGGLACALRAANELGYTPTRGGVNDGYVLVEKPRENDMGRVLSTLPGVRRPTDGHEINITQTTSGLRVAVYSYYQRQGYDRRQEKPSGEATEHAQSILTTCGSPAA